MSSKATGLKGVVLDETRIALIDGDEGKLVYRGYNIHDLAPHAIVRGGLLPAPVRRPAGRERS